MSLYSVVVPVYNSEHTLGELYTRLEKVFRETLKEDFELILVDDGSKDRSYEIMTELREKDHRVRIIQMARNFGQHPALLCGFAHVKGEFVVTMDDDLQHQPEELPKMVRTMQERPDVDVIIRRAMKEESMARYANWERNFCMGNFKDAGKRSGSSDHQLQADPQIPCGCHGKNKYISSTDWKPSDQEF